MGERSQLMNAHFPEWPCVEARVEADILENVIHSLPLQLMYLNTSFKNMYKAGNKISMVLLQQEHNQTIKMQKSCA